MKVRIQWLKELKMYNNETWVVVLKQEKRVLAISFNSFLD